MGGGETKKSHLKSIGYEDMRIWLFPKIGVPQNGWFLGENPIRIDGLGYPYFWKHLYIRVKNTPSMADPPWLHVDLSPVGSSGALW